MRMLVIEDNEQNRYLLTFLLRQAGHEVVEATSGPAGLAIAEEANASLVLLDIQLPGMDGYEVARRLRSSPRTAAVPIVAITSYAMLGDRDKAIAAGCSGYIEKPINPDTFLDQIGRYVPGRPPEEQP